MVLKWKYLVLHMIVFEDSKKIRYIFIFQLMHPIFFYRDKKNSIYFKNKKLKPHLIKSCNVIF